MLSYWSIIEWGPIMGCDLEWTIFLQSRHFSGGLTSEGCLSASLIAAGGNISFIYKWRCGRGCVACSWCEFLGEIIGYVYICFCTLFSQVQRNKLYIAFWNSLKASGAWFPPKLAQFQTPSNIDKKI